MPGSCVLHQHQQQFFKTMLFLWSMQWSRPLLHCASAKSKHVFLRPIAPASDISSSMTNEAERRFMKAVSRKLLVMPCHQCASTESKSILPAATIKKLSADGCQSQSTLYFLPNNESTLHRTTVSASAIFHSIASEDKQCEEAGSRKLPAWYIDAVLLPRVKLPCRGLLCFRVT